MELLTLDDFNLRNKKVLLRVDINSPIDPRTNDILDDTRLKSHLSTIKDLSDSKVIILAHQSRPGREDFTTLEKHASRIDELVNGEVKYVDSIHGIAAKREIDKLRNGQILVLENVRFCSEEVSENVIRKSPEGQAKTNFVKKLSSYVDFYVNDAFAVSHRSQPSIVAFPMVLESCIGRLMEKEIRVLSRVMGGNEKPRVFSLGGAKVKDSFMVVRNVLKNNIATKVLTSGLLGNAFLLASGCDLGKKNKEFLSTVTVKDIVPEAQELLKKYKDKIEMPIDLAFQKNGSRVEASVEDMLDYKVLDIGIETIVRYSKIIKDAKVIVANGPCGVYEIEGFALGTEELLKSIAQSEALSVVGGGHLGAVAKKVKVSGQISHLSTGGSACTYFLAGEQLPGMEVMRTVAERYKK